MKVWQLIKRLQDMPPEADVCIFNPERRLMTRISNEPLVTSGQNEYGRSVIQSVGIPMEVEPKQEVAPSDFQDVMLIRMGFDSPEKRALRERTLNTIHSDGKLWGIMWKHQDAYGRPGAMPAQGYDWSGFRDSSFAAIERMAKELGLA